jgi:ribonuclease HI
MSPAPAKIRPRDPMLVALEQADATAGPGTGTVSADGGGTAQGAGVASSGMAVVEIWTDGGCKPNPGPGGWGAVLVSGGQEKALTGAEPATTNNRMELTAAAAALEALTRPCRVVVHTDSEYVRNGITRWSTGWVRKGWRTSSGDPVKNMDLWRRLLEAAGRHRVEWRWVRGHSGDVMNERVDVLATEARVRMEREASSLRD